MNLLIIPSRTFGVTPARLVRIQEAVPGLTVLYTAAPTGEQVSESEIIFGCLNPGLLAGAENLRWHHITNAGVEPYGDRSLYARGDTVLTNARGVYGVQIAEHALGMMLALSRQLPYYTDCTRRREWARRNDVRELYGSTVAIFGTGDLGQSLAARLAPFGCSVLGVRRNILELPDGFSELYPPHRMLDALSRSDYVVSCLPQTPQTVGIFNREAFDAMPPQSIFINVGRGSSVVESALVCALRSGRLMGAGLDVTDPEPLPPESELWDFENVLITAHSSAASPCVDARNFGLFMEQLERWSTGRRLRNIVDFRRGY